MKEETNLWLRKAYEDISTVNILMQNNQSPPAIICYHCQQAAEKLLKCFLVENDIEFPRTHDLTLLLERYILPLDPDFEEIRQSAIDLSEFSVTSRYPDASNDIDLPIAREAFQAASLIQSFVLGKLKPG
ncbi:MAG: HEPN domain-containing protein [Bacteroidetes bacterium]|nr:HEPN domain-containing protein [Bacteroidota bacterium]